MFSFLLPFTVLRQYAGGIHLEKPTSCIIFSGFLVFGCGQYLAVTSDIGFSFFFLWLIAVLVIFMLVPIDTKGKNSYWKECKNVSRSNLGSVIY